MDGTPQPGVVDGDLVHKRPGRRVPGFGLFRRASSKLHWEAVKSPNPYRKYPQRLGGQQFSSSWFKQQNSSQKVQKRGTVQWLTTKKKKPGAGQSL